MQKIDVHHVDKSTAVLQLFQSFIELEVQGFKTLIAKRLVNCLHKGFKGEREGGSDLLQNLAVLDRSQFRPQQECNEAHPRFFIVDEEVLVVAGRDESVPQLLLVVDG